MDWKRLQLNLDRLNKLSVVELWSWVSRLLMVVQSFYSRTVFWQVSFAHLAKQDVALYCYTVMDKSNHLRVDLMLISIAQYLKLLLNRIFRSL